MLVLSRKQDERIVLKYPGSLGKEIVITVVRIDGGNRVRIGIEAERDVKVIRSELQES